MSNYDLNSWLGAQRTPEWPALDDCSCKRTSCAPKRGLQSCEDAACSPPRGPSLRSLPTAFWKNSSTTAPPITGSFHQNRCQRHVTPFRVRDSRRKTGSGSTLGGENRQRTIGRRTDRMTGCVDKPALTLHVELCQDGCWTQTCMCIINIDHLQENKGAFTHQLTFLN